MEVSVRQRIVSVLKEKGVTINSLSKGNKAFQRKLNRQINEGAVITIETITSILNAFPDVSAEWLLTGDGTMIKSELSGVIEKLKTEIDQLKGENRVLREQLRMGLRIVVDDQELI